MDFAKPAPVQLKPTPIHELLDHTLEFLNNDLLKHKIKVIRNYQLEHDLKLNIDANQLKQALLNIFLNAIEAMPSAGELLVSSHLSAMPDYAMITIHDTGIGIAKEDVPHIFDPFFTKKDHGTGLGLSITHEIIKNHNGRIFVESQIGKGTMFAIELPL